jgi:hypothetical protein
VDGQLGVAGSLGGREIGRLGGAEVSTVSGEDAVRFVEVVANGPKSWSLAAALHPDIAAAYDAAQDRAAIQIVGWLAQHATTRVGPRGGQVQVPVEELEAVTVAHHTSRAGDPHRHLHLQINARGSAAASSTGVTTSLPGSTISAQLRAAVDEHRGRHEGVACVASLADQSLIEGREESDGDDPRSLAPEESRDRQAGAHHALPYGEAVPAALP